MIYKIKFINICLLFIGRKSLKGGIFIVIVEISRG